MTPETEERLRNYIIKIMGVEASPRRWLRMSDDQRDAIRKEFDELPFPPLTRVLMQRRLIQLYTGKRSKARVPIEAGPDDIRILASEVGRFRPITWMRRHRPPSLEAQPGESQRDLYRRDVAHMWLHLAFVLVAEETMPRRKLAAATSPEVVAAKVSAHLAATPCAGAGEKVAEQAHD
jgi:hypothetical protein